MKDYNVSNNPSPLYHMVITSAGRKCVGAEAGNASRVSRTSGNMAELRRLAERRAAALRVLLRKCAEMLSMCWEFGASKNSKSLDFYKKCRNLV